MSARFETFPLRTTHHAILPEHHSLVVDANGIITLVDWNAHQFIETVDTLEDEAFTLLVSFFRAWPNFIPYEHALSEIGIILTDGELADFSTIRTQTIGTDPYNQARRRIDALLTTVREMLKTTRTALQTIGIDIASVLDCGYTLIKYVKQP
jgi:hypothetical protein